MDILNLSKLLLERRVKAGQREDVSASLSEFVSGVIKQHALDDLDTESNKIKNGLPGLGARFWLCISERDDFTMTVSTCSIAFVDVRVLHILG